MSLRKFPSRGVTLFLVGCVGAFGIVVRCYRGPSAEELVAFVYRTEPGVSEVAVTRTHDESTGVTEVRVRRADGRADGWGYEFSSRWVWPWQSYFDGYRAG